MEPMTDLDREFNAMCDRQRPKTHGEIRDEMIRANIEAAGGIEGLKRFERAPKIFGWDVGAAKDRAFGWIDFGYGRGWQPCGEITIYGDLTPDPDPLQEKP